MIDPAALADHYADYLIRTRWFGGKGRAFTVTEVEEVATLPSEQDPRVAIELITVSYADGAEPATETYQVPVAFYRDPETRLDHAFIGWWESADHGWVHAYDALHDREAMALWLAAFGAMAIASPADPSLTFHRLPGHDLDLTATSTLFSGEQSNSSVAFGEDSLMKVFRKITPGINPDISVHRELTEAGCERVAALYGWVEHTTKAGEPMQVAMLQQFLRTASDGWELALGSVRNLYSEIALDTASFDVHAFESGGDFAGESGRLGAALREIHEILVDRFPTEQADPTALVARMRTRWFEALAAVPDLGVYADKLETIFARLGALDSVPVQQVHGDLHLGQTLRTAIGWKVVDFEGEPARPLAERLLPDSPWRDVAGMLRSFDYAPQVVLRGLADDRPELVPELEGPGAEWSARNRSAFLNAYTDGTLSDADHTLLTAYIADKAVYECVYEARNRPTWLEIPMAAVAALEPA